MSEQGGVITGAAEKTQKPKRQSAKAEIMQETAAAIRDWGGVVKRIQELKAEGITVPEIAQELELSYQLVNQVMLQSYKMTIDTLALFEREEKRRLGLEP